LNQGCQMVYFQTKNTNLGKFWRALWWQILVHLMPIWYILWPFGIFCGHLVYFSPVLVCCSKKNPATLIWMHFLLFWMPEKCSQLMYVCC
jgi:hypothetical protein